MKFIHTADLHIGKRLYEQSLLEDQRHILRQIVEVAQAEAVDAVVIAGDVYDRGVPSTEAVELLDEFLTALIEKGIRVILISGNHDSAARLSFAEQILEKQGLYIIGDLERPLRQVILEDEYGPVHFLCMPFRRPAEAGCESSAELMEGYLSVTPRTLDLRSRYVVVAHYFVVGENGEQPLLSESESDLQVGGLDAASAACLANFDYVALGHIHKPQQVGNGRVYYSGSPLKYSFSEAETEKGVLLVELKEQLETSVRMIPLKPLRDLRRIRGRLADLIDPGLLAQQEGDLEDYIQVTLTDQEEVLNPMETLRKFYPNVLNIVIEKNSVLASGEYEPAVDWTHKGIGQLFGEFYELLRGEPMEERRGGIVDGIVKAIEEERP